MMETKNVELVFVPSLGLSHLTSTVEMAKLLLDRDSCLSIIVPIMKLPTDRAVDSYIKKHLLRFEFTLSGLVLDMFCTKFIQVTDEFNLPAYAFFTSSAAAFGLNDHLVSLVREQIEDLANDQSFNEDIKKWLDDQLENSGCFLVLWTMESFEEAQVKEITLALENGGSRFLWSLRKPGQKGVMELTEYEDFNEVLLKRN
ncbi:UNVERIFIED_CONTAM: UDP-glycosyltransferase 71E1 [Sesamum radiatum]|uniref:UDP-glycosyltransferase 71E1 n=1 Tax=Sesamum radiatum TaxID=300843 RepID=A0AAW2T5I3_SESRA